MPQAGMNNPCNNCTNQLEREGLFIDTIDNKSEKFLKEEYKTCYYCARENFKSFTPVATR